MTNEYDDLLASDGAKDEARTNLRASVLAALPANPDQVAEAKRLSKTTGLPAPVVERNLDKVKQQATLNEYDGLIERAPVTASKMQDRQFAKVAHPERDQLAELEEFIKRSPGQQDTSTGAALKRGTAMLGQIGEAMGYGLDRALTAIGKRFLPEPAIPGGEIDATGSQAKASLIQVANLYSSLPRDKRIEFAGELVNRAAAEGETLRGMGDAMAYIARNPGAALNYLTEMAPSAAAGGVVGGLTARPLAAAAAQRVVARSAAAGVVTPGAAAASQAVSRGVTAAAVTAAGTTTNAFPAELAGQISGGAEVDDALAYAGKKAAVEGLVNAPFAFAGGMLPLGSTLLGRTGNILGQAGLQGAGGATGAAAAAASVGEDITPGEMFLEAFFEVATAPVDIAIAAATSVAEQRDATKAQADKATASADYLNKIMAAAAASKTRTRDPETFAQLVQDAAESSGTAPTEVFIDAQPLVDTLQKAGMTEAQIREMLPSVAEQLGAEYATGGTVAIPIGELVTAFSGAGVEAELVKFLRTSPDGFSVADSEQALAQLEEMDADAQRIIAEQQDADAWEMSAKAVEDTLFAQFEGSGRWSSDVNRVLATVARNFFVTQADAVGVTPDELYRQFPLTVSGVAPTGQVLNQPNEGTILRPLPSSAADTAPVGSWVVSDVPDIRGTPVLQVRELRVDDLYLPELTADGKLQPEKQSYLDGYTSRLLAGEKAPNLYAVEMEDGRIRVVDGHRRALAAKAAGQDTVRVLVSPLTDSPDGDGTKVTLTSELAARNTPTTFDQEVKGTTPYAADTIEVDGKTRPAVNNKGQRIAQTEEGLRNFWRWFGDSKVVDEQGRPLVVYHGTASDFDAFDGPAYFTAEPGQAADYARNQAEANGGAARSVPVYLSLQSPAVVDQSYIEWAGYEQAEIDKLTAQGYDGMMNAAMTEVVAFTPTQIKSATGNRGTFNPADPNILNQEGGYRGEHRAPGPRDGAPGHDLTGGGQVYPDDVYTHGSQYYGTGSDLDGEAFSIAAYLKGRPTRPVKIYRAVPYTPTNAERADALQKQIDKFMAKGVWPGGTRTSNAGSGEWYAQTTAEIERLRAVPDEGGQRIKKINPGDWVAITRGYAKDHGESVFGPGNYKIISKTVTAKEIFTNGDSIQEWGYWPEGSDELYQSVYHGSPYRFSKFSLEHMGKGEGAQAYGWGLYFAGKREVAEHYRQVLTTRSPDALQRHALKNGLQAEVADAMAQFHARAKSSSFDDFASMTMEKSPSEYIELFREKYLRPAIVDGSAKAVWDSFKEAGQLYEVNIPEDGEYLLWDKPLAEQPEKVRTALEKADVMDPSVFSQYTGEQFYEGMVRDGVTFDGMTRSAAQEKASRYLNSLGITGIKYLDGTSRADGDGSYNYVIFDDAAIEIVNTFYQQEGAKAQPEKQGSFNPATLNIALLEKADLSTALHELGHFFFEMQATIAARPDAPARIAEDVATLLKTVGFEGTAAEWLAQPLNDRREAHEQVAETFEQYLLTGKAPSLELQGLFNRMRAWMLSVYKTLKRFFAIRNRAGLSPEVSAVFDRMLATDAAIAEAKRVRAMTPLFKSAEEAGMDPEAWAAYQQAAGQVDEDAIRDLDARQVRDMKWLRSARSKALKALQADASAKRREARIEARRRLLQEPVYRAMQFLRGKVEQAPVEKKSKGLDTRRDDLLTAIAKLGGINKEMAVAEWGIDPKDFATSPVFGSPILRGGKSGRSPDGMAEALAEVGYLMPKDGARYVLTDLEDMLADSARGISHYSLDADYDLIHGYKTLPAPADLGEQPFAAGRLSRPDLEARFAGSDVEWQKLGIGRRGMIAEMGMDADAVANIVGFNTGEEMVKALLAAEALQDATEALTDQIMLERHGDITSPEGLQRAADEALANDAHAKMLATEYARLDKAVGSPRAVERAAREAALRTVDRQAVRLARPDKATAAAARAGKAAQKAHAAGNLEEAAGFKRNQILNTAIARAQRELRTFVEKAQGDFAKMFGKDAQLAKTRDMNLVNLARAALAQYGLAPEAGGMKALQYLNLVKQYDPALAANLESMLEAMPEGKDFRELTGGEFRTVADLVRGMWEMSRGVKQITIDGKKVELDLVADELVEAVRTNNGGETGTLPGYSGTTTKVDDLRVGALGIKSMLTRVEQWADAMGPAFKRYVWQPVSEAVTRYRTRRTEMVGQYRDLLKTIESGLTYHKIHAPELGLGGFTFNGGKSEVLHAVLHSGNESNLRKLLLGRGWAVQDEEGNVDASKWQEFVQRMVDDGVLTREDFDFVQGVWDLLETVKADAQKAHRELYGYYFNEVTATPFIDPFGVERRGGYVPAIADGLSSPDAMQKREQEELLHAGNSFMFPSTGKGFTQARVEYNRPLELDLRTIASHLDKVARFAYIEPAVRDVGKILLNKRVSRALNGYDQTIISSMLNPWLQRAARQTVSKPGMNRYADKFFNALRTRSGVVIMFANVVNTLQQLTGFSVAALKVPAPKLLRATYRMMANPKQMSAEAAALSPWLADRMSGQSFEMQQQIENILLNTNAVAKGNEFLVRNAYFMQQAMQNAMDPIIWWGAYDHAIEQGLSQQDAVRAADSAVRTTQGTFAPEDVAAFESNTAFVRLFTQFYGYFNMLGNTIGAEAKKAIRDMGYGAATPRLLFIWFAGLALPAVVGEIIARGLPDDEDDEDGDGLLDEYMALFFGTQGRTLAAMAPGLGQGVTLAFNMTDDKVYNDRLSISPGLSMAETTVRGGVTLLQGEMFDERLTKTEVRDFFTLIGMAVGAPTGPLARAGGYMADVENGRADPESTPELVKGLVVGR